jgi:stage IV sporulation protein B
MGTLKKIRKKIGKICISLLTLTVLTAAGGGALAYAEALIPLGNAVGINILSEGVMVVGVPEILADGKSVSPARSAGLEAGDIITKIGTRTISSGDDMKLAIAGLDGTQVPVTVMRDGSVLKLMVTPHKTADGRCELGIWMRDGVSGIGTMTFYDPETGTFGALGHSVNDIETGIRIPMRSGTVSSSVVTDVAQGKAGLPGQLHGTFNTEGVLGNLTVNSPCGIFGKMGQNKLLKGKTPMPVADDSEIKTGPAYILSNVSGTDVKEYDVEITRLYTGDEAIGRSMMLRVTDPGLIAQTGGIVQGMSGSPIIQNGKIVGAVTHVLGNDPTRGYGVSIRNMLDIMDNAENKAA